MSRYTQFFCGLAGGSARSPFQSMESPSAPLNSDQVYAAGSVPSVAVSLFTAMPMYFVPSRGCWYMPLPSGLSE